MPSLDPSEVVGRRYDFVHLFDVTDGNPNGDPDADNLPRVDPQTMHGLVTDACLKRKVRDYITIRQSLGESLGPGYGIYVQVRGVLERHHIAAYREQLGLDEAAARRHADADHTEAARQWMCRNFFDVRAFGAVMSLGVNCGQVRGPLQLTFARSVDPIAPLDMTIVRKAVATEREFESQVSRHGQVTGTLGRKNTVPYALYVGHGFVNPYLARDTGFTYGDLALFFEALSRMFELDRSAARGLMAVRGIHVFEHESALGNAPAHELFDRIRITPIGDAEPPRRFGDYAGRIEVNTARLPEGVRYFDDHGVTELFRQHCSPKP